MDVVEFRTGEFGEFKTASVVKVGPTPTGPAAAEYFVTAPKELVAVIPTRKYLPVSPDPMSNVWDVDPEITVQSEAKLLLLAPGESQLYHWTVIAGVGTPCQAPEFS